MICTGVVGWCAHCVLLGRDSEILCRCAYVYIIYMCVDVYRGVCVCVCVGGCVCVCR